MPKKKTTRRKPAPEAYAHPSADRLNLPTEETAPFMAAEDRAPYRYEPPLRQDEHGEPRLSWDRGEDADDLAVDAHPLYIHEKIHPAAFVRTLTTTPADRRQTRALFGAAYNNLPDRAAYEWYEHRGNWQNRLIRGDSRRIMASLAERDRLAGSVQMVFYDPPYGIRFNSNFQPSVKNRGGEPSGKDIPNDPVIVQAFRDTYENGIHSYLDNIRRNAVLARTLLHDSGSLFVQIGSENVHRLAVLLDEVFGTDNHVVTIPFVKAGSSSATTLPDVTDYLLWYAKDRVQIKFRQIYEHLNRREKVEHMTSYAMVELADGSIRTLDSSEAEDPDEHLPSGARLFQLTRLTSPGTSPTGRSEPVVWNGKKYPCPPNEQWRVDMDGIHFLDRIGRLAAKPNGKLHYKKYENEIPGRKINNMWKKQMSATDLHYVVETAEKVVERCILMSTDPSDLVLDITCGSGTTAFVAEKWGRRWITTDAAAVPIALARQRIAVGAFPYHLLQDSVEGVLKEREISDSTDGGSEARRLGGSEARRLGGGDGGGGDGGGRVAPCRRSGEGFRLRTGSLCQRRRSGLRRGAGAHPSRGPSVQEKGCRPGLLPVHRGERIPVAVPPR